MFTPESESKSTVRRTEPFDGGLHRGQRGKGGDVVDDVPSWPYLRDAMASASVVFVLYHVLLLFFVCSTRTMSVAAPNE